MNEEQKRRRYARWEEIGEDAIRADMQSGGYRLVGGSPEVRRLAQQWLNEKQQARAAGEEPGRAQQEGRETRRFFWTSVLAILAIVVAIVLFLLSG
ncbi:MAG: hypothetical protein ACRDGA_01745 [Bacteroidota bacterium]